jgi:hypothetical protein
MIPEQEKIEDRIRRTAVNTDHLIIKLDTLTNRIDTAKANENRELVDYYERQFAETSVEFLDSVETILDDWYALKGEARPPAQSEYIAPETLESIHETVVSIVQGLPAAMPEIPIAGHAAEASGKAGAIEGGAAQGSSEPRHRVDVTG